MHFSLLCDLLMQSKKKCKIPSLILSQKMLLSAGGTGEEVQELNRQNRITEQILTNFFERKFFPNRKPRPAPTIDEILPPDAKPQVPGKLKDTPQGDDDELDENLQSVESEHVDSFYRDYEGKLIF